MVTYADGSILTAGSFNQSILHITAASPIRGGMIGSGTAWGVYGSFQATGNSDPAFVFGMLLTGSVGGDNTSWFLPRIDSNSFNGGATVSQYPNSDTTPPGGHDRSMRLAGRTNAGSIYIPFNYAIGSGITSWIYLLGGGNDATDVLVAIGSCQFYGVGI